MRGPTGKRGRRRARLVAGVLAVTLAFAASAGGYAITQQRKAQTAVLVSDAARLGALARAGGDYDRALLLAAQAVTLNPTPETESDLFATLLRGDAVVATMRAPDRAQAMAFGPDFGSIVAVTASGDLVRWPAGGGPGVVLSHLAQSPGLVSYNGISGVGAQIAVAIDGRIVVGVSSDLSQSSLQLVDADTAKVLHQVSANVAVGWALAPDRKVVVAAAGSIAAPSSDVLIWRLGTVAPDVVPIGDNPIRIAMCGADIACVLTDRQLVRVRLSDATVERRLPLPRDTVDAQHPEIAERLVGSPDGRAVAIVSLDGRLRILDARTGQLMWELTGATRDLHALAFSPDGSRIVAGDYASVLIWRTDGSGLPERHEVHGGRVVFADWSADGSTLATLGRDGGVVLLDMTGRRRVGAVLTNALDARTTTLWATPRAIVVGQVNGRLLFVEPADGTINPAAERPHGRNAIDSARSGLAGDLLITADYLGGTAVWDVATRRLLGTVDLPTEPGNYTGQAWVSPDGRYAAAMRSTRGGPVIFDVITRRVLRRLPPLPPPDAQLEASVTGWTADGRSILIIRQLTNTTSDVLVVDATSGAVKLRVDTKGGLTDRSGG